MTLKILGGTELALPGTSSIGHLANDHCIRFFDHTSTEMYRYGLSSPTNLGQRCSNRATHLHQMICWSDPAQIVDVHIAALDQQSGFGRPPQPTQKCCAALSSRQNVCGTLLATSPTPMPLCRLGDPFLDVLPLRAPGFLERLRIVLRTRTIDSIGERFPHGQRCT